MALLMAEVSQSIAAPMTGMSPIVGLLLTNVATWSVFRTTLEKPNLLYEEL